NSEEAYDRIVDLRKRWQQGDATFEELAREYSDDPMTANLGGDMGWVQPVHYGDRIKQIVDSLETGQACQPFQDEAGWHVMLVEDRRSSDVTDLALRNQAKSILKQQKSEREYETFLRQLRDESYVEIRG
nr:peptidylprolyl isomerase [Gammaproteobacteria bacterium]